MINSSASKNKSVLKNMIFHIPMQIDPKMQSGSQVRPHNMIQAFKNIGYNVDVVMGYVKNRKKQIAKIKENINNGVKYDFLYSESSTMPTTLTEKNHLPIAPFLDFDFFKFCKQYGIKIGLFYRDIHWKFEQYKKQTPFFLRIIAELFYKYDLDQYKKTVDVLYLPSEEMYEYMPLNFSKKIASLPPAAKQRKIEYQYAKDYKSLSFIYVGGISELYDLTLFSNVISQYNAFTFNLCTRKNEWEANENQYENYSIKIHYKSGDELRMLYKDADISVLFVKPNEYWKFVMAIKLFEYLSFLKPIISVKNTAVGDFIEKNSIGWAIEYNEQSLLKLIDHIHKTPNEIREKISNMEKMIVNNTWEARAKQVVKDLES